VTAEDRPLIAALARAQAAFPQIPKSKTARVPTKNGGEYTYTYADIGDVLAAVRPVLAAEGIAIVQATEETESGYVLATRLIKGDDQIIGRIPLPIEQASPQQVGSLLTYYRRYGLTALIGVAAEDDDDGAAANAGLRHDGERSPSRPASAAQASEKQTAYATRLLTEVVHHSQHLQAIRDMAAREDADLGNLTAAEASDLINGLLVLKKAGRTPDGDLVPADELTEPF
jgi:hypothetical protein